MKRSFKSFKLPKAIRRVFALLLVCGIFAVAGLAYADGENVRIGNTQKTRSEVVALFDSVQGLPNGTSATDFAVFANKFTLTSDMEGAIAVNNLEVTGGNIGATTNVTDTAKYTVNIEKTVDTAVNYERKFKVGIYQGEVKALVKTVEITVPAGQTSGKASVNTKGLNGDKYYIFELDQADNPINNGSSGVMADGNTYVANVSPSSFTIDRLDVYNTSYINNFKGTHDSLVHSEIKATVWVGNENAVVKNGDKIAIKNNDDQILTFGNKNVVEVKQNLSGDFPIDFDAAFTSLKSLSSTIADLRSSDDVKVINMPVGTNGEIDYTNITCDGNKVFSDQNNYENNGFQSEGKLIIFNVDCTKLSANDTLYLNRSPKIDGQQLDSWNTFANNIIWNFYTVDSNGSYGTFKGEINQGKAGACPGVVLAPDAYFYNGSNMNGTVIAKETTHNSEYHHIKLIDNNINVTVNNTSSNTGSLKIKKNITVNREPSSNNSTVGNGVYSFDILNSDKTKVVKTAEITVTNGVSGETVVSGLEPGHYYVRENVNKLPSNISLTSDNDVYVEVKANNVSQIPVEASFTNNVVVGSLKIEKSVTLNGNSTETTDVDGDYVFLVKNEKGDTVATKTITISNGNSNTVTVEGLAPGTYTIEEIDSGNGTTLSKSENTTITIEENKISEVQIASFTNNLNNTGSLKIQKMVTDNNQVINDNRADGTYSFEILNKSDKQPAKYPNGQEVGEIALKVENGISEVYEVSGLEPGDYLIRELNIPNTMELLGGNDKEVKVTANNSTLVETTVFTNNILRGSLKIQKNVTINKESAIGSILADGTYKFVVKDDIGGVVATPEITVTNGNSNMAIVEGLLPGKYTIEETTDGTGKATLVDSKNTEITITKDKITEVQTAEFTNNIDIQVGSLNIKKNVTLNGATINGTANKTKVDGLYTFYVFDENNVKVAERNINITNGESKTITVENLAPGKYTVKEDISNFKNGLSLVEYKDGIVVEVEANNSTKIPTASFTNNLTEGEIEITKKVTLNGVGTTGKLADGTFTFTISGPDGYSREEKITVTNGKADPVKLTELKPGTYTISEKDTDGFNLTGVEVSNGTVNENNVVTVEIKENTTGKAQVEAVTFTNNKEVGSLKITKNVTLNGNPTDKVNGTYNFVVINENGETVAEKSIKIEEGKSKTVTVDNLKPGRYTVKEVVENLENGTTITEGKDGIEVIVTANNSGDAIGVAEFTNNLTEGEIEITKEVTLNGEATKRKLADGTFEFEVKDENGKVVAKPTITVKDGEAETKTLTGLKPGKYTIKETDSDGLELKGVEVSNGIVDENNVVTVEITDENTSKKAQVEAVTFTNNKEVTGSLKITKNVTVNGKETESRLVDGTYYFNITGPNYSETVGVEIKDGKPIEPAVVTGLYPGKYTITEDTTGFGENLTVDKENVEVEITLANYDETQEVEFTNNLKVDDATLTIKKEINKDTNQYSEAAIKLYTFKITNDEVADGTKYVANDGVNSITFNNGEATLTIKGDSEVSFAGLKAGEYKVEEIDAEVIDYKLSTDYKDTSGDKDDQTVELTDGQVAMITVTNSYEYDGQVADMSITKVLKNYNQTFKGGTFVFEVTGTKVNSNGETEMIYSGIIGATTDKAGNLSVDKLTNLPVEPGVTYTVKEVYSGSVYSPVNDTVVITLNSQEDIDRYKDENGKIVLTAAFENDYNGTTIGGAGVINIYGLNDGIKQVFE